MYENLGAVVDAHNVQFRLFLPDVAHDPAQYLRGASPRIAGIRVTGTFQSHLGQTNWDTPAAPLMTKNVHERGWLYTFNLSDLPDGFYEYKYFVEFENSTTRWCSDPCTSWDGSEEENSAFVVGGNDMAVSPIVRRLPLRDLVIYELMIDDFTAEFRAGRAPLDAIRDKLDYLQDLGINAIEFMPWTSWPKSGFSWGYDPFAFFSVEHSYYDDPSAPLDKLFRLKRLIGELHARGIHVIMDGVFNHVRAGQSPDHGFPYYWLYQDPADSPYIGNFAGGGFFEEFDYANECTNQFIIDICKYWIEEYKIDGIRFDYALGFFRQSDPPVGIARVIRDLNAHAAVKGLDNMAFFLELLTDNRYAAIDDTNRMQAGGCWFDPLKWAAGQAAASGRAAPTLMRPLHATRDFTDDRRPITYIENHDHMTITEVCGGRASWWRTQPAAIALLTAPGTPLIHNGQEFAEQYWFPEDGDQRVQPRPLRWGRADDGIGTTLRDIYNRLIRIRNEHPALRSANFYPDVYDERLPRFNQFGYGVDEDRGIVIYHRWHNREDGAVERFIIALNFSGAPQAVDIPFSVNGRWDDLLNNSSVQIEDFWLRGEVITSHWGRVFRNAG